MAGKQRKYRDLNLSFYAHPVTKDVAILKDVDAVKRSVRNLVLTDHYERFFQPNIGSGVVQSLFENMTIATRYQLQTSIEDTIRTYEPRVNLLSVSVIPSPDNNSIEVRIVFEVVNTLEPVTVDVFLERVR